MSIVESRLRALLLGTVAACSIEAGFAASSLAQSQPPAVPPGVTVLAPIVVKQPKDETPTPQRQAAPKEKADSAPRKRSAPSAAAATSPPPVAAPPAAVSAFDALTTGAGKSAATIYDAPSTVSVKSAAEIERQLITTPRDLVRDEPGVSVGNQPSRTGATNYAIRGIGENRVRLEIDGVKVPDFPGTNVGPGTYTRDFVDLDALKRAEIIRGPASALYGSDAIGGVVSYVTKDPADYLDLVGKNWFTSIKGGFDTADQSVYTTLTGAARTAQFDQLVVYTRKWAHEVEPNGRRTANPQTSISNNVLGKIVYNGSNAAKLTLTGELLDKSVSTEILTERTATVLSSDGVDDTSRRRLSLDYVAPVSLWVADAIKVKAYGTDLDRNENTRQLRLSAGQQRDRVTDAGWEQQTIGGEIQFTKFGELAGTKHEMIYGVTVDTTSSSRPRRRTETNLVTGAVTSTFAGEVFPNKNFPDTDTTQAAAYIQDTIQIGALRVIPAVRLDYFSLTPHADQMFANSNTANFKINEQTETAISPKLGLTYDLNDQVRLFGQYARGFRAPPYDNANFGFSNPLQGYEILPNGNLIPETSNGFEGGIRGRDAKGSSFQLTAFHNSYENFIESVVTGFSPAGLMQFQFQNVSNVTIYGYEGKGELKFAPNWSVFGSFAFAHGTNEDTGAALDSVDPFTGIGGIRYRGISGWGGELRAKYVSEKDHVSSATVFRTPAYTTVDALLSYETVPSMTINVGVFNIFDESYFNPQDVAGIAANSSNLELFRAPGRSLASNVTFRW